jgi:hypothetical protein
LKTPTRSVLAALLVVLLSAVAAPAEVVDRILAVVGGQIVTQSDVRAAATFGLAANLQELIDRTLMISEVRRVSPPDPPGAAVQARLARIRGRFESSAAMEQALELNGLTDASIRSYSADDLRLSTYLDERFSAASQPTEEEVRQAGETSRARLASEHRQVLVTAWIAELRRRTEITILAE